MGNSRLLLGNSREILDQLDENSIDAVVTDPPYEIDFMGGVTQGWDKSGIAFDPVFWKQVLRVLKPGGHMVSFGACRTIHRIAVGIEDGGFTIRDQLQWIFGSGFPKSMNISLALDNAAGAVREDRVVGDYGDNKVLSPTVGVENAGAPVTDEAKQWEGWGTNLKWSYEPIVLAQKPCEGTIMGSVVEHGTGGLNIDACRVGDGVGGWGGGAGGGGTWNESNCGLGKDGSPRPVEGRFPPNVLISPEIERKLGDRSKIFPVFDWSKIDHWFYAAKASRSEREQGCEHLPAKIGSEINGKEPGKPGSDNPRAGIRAVKPIHNFHPTVKPVSLMRWLCRLITPPGGTVLDPFMGSGTTGIGAVSEGFDFVGIEMDPDHHAICMARIHHAGTIPPETNRPDYVAPKKKQMGLFG